MGDRTAPELTLKYLAGMLTPIEREAFERRLKADEALARELAFVRQICDGGPDLAGVPESTLDTWWAAVSGRIAADRTPPARPAFARRHAWRIAAAVAVVVGASLAGLAVLGRRVGPSSDSTSIARTLTTRLGQRMAFRLADGSTATLAPGSKLTMTPEYGTQSRALELVGQAAFEVRHDSRRPFIVRAGGIVAKDLGTRFVVQAYSGDRAIDVVVAEGIVAVSRAMVPADTVVLKHGDRAHVGESGTLAVTHNVPLESYFGWTEGRLVFHRTPLDEVARQIERWYDVEIRLASPELATRGFTAASRSGQSVDGLLRAVATTLDLDVIRTGPRTYTLRAR